MEVMDKWVAEFFLLRQQNPRVNASLLLSAMNPVDSDDCVKFKTTAVLRDISNTLIRGTIDEGMLDLLEILEKLLLQEHTVIMESLKSAYCWTAVECTVKFMWPVIASDGLFGDALERIWKKRIGKLKERESDLVTDQLLKWESDLNMAFKEPEMYEKIRESNIRYNAITHLNQVLNEQWVLLGCSTLESEVQKRFLKRKDSPNVSRDRDNNSSRVDETIDNVNDVEEMGDVENLDEVGEVNQQEQEHEGSLNEDDITVARELKDLLLEIQELIDLPTMQQQEEPNDVTPQSNQANMSESGRGQDHNDAENSQETSSVRDHNEAENSKGSSRVRDHNEAENSQGSSSTSSFRRVRPHLPTPEPLKVSPLEKGRVEKSHPRRKVKFWSPEEVEALREGVKEYGKSWKDVKNSNPVVFADRSEVDLKDKWRNLFGRK